MKLLVEVINMYVIMKINICKKTKKLKWLICISFLHVTLLFNISLTFFMLFSGGY